MIISFAMTTAAFMEGRKTVTRRRWADVTAARWKAGTLHAAWNKLPRAGASARQIGIVRATVDAYREPLRDMPLEDVAREGTPATTVEEFIRFIDGRPDEVLWVARFEIVELFPEVLRADAR